jgi:CRP-like cAMP-binding protein
MDELVGQYEARLARWPEDVEAHLGLSHVLAERGELRGASSHALKAARLHGAAGRYEEAVEACQRSLRCQPDHMEAALFLTTLYARRPVARVVEVIAPAPALEPAPLILLETADAVEELSDRELDQMSSDLSLEEERELQHLDEEELLSQEIEVIRPEDVLDVIDASEDAFYRGARPVATSVTRDMKALHDPPTVPGYNRDVARWRTSVTGDWEAMGPLEPLEPVEPIEGLVVEPIEGQDPEGPPKDSGNFGAIADLIHDSLNAHFQPPSGSQGSSDEGFERPDFFEPPVPGWSRAGKHPRSPEAVLAPAPPMSDLEALWLPDSMEEAREVLAAQEAALAAAELPTGGADAEQGLDPALARCAFVQELGDRARRCAQGELVLREGVPHHSLFFVQSGELSFERRTEAGPQKLATLKPGDMFGEFELLLRCAPRVQVRAARETTLLEVTERVLTEMSVLEMDLWDKLWAFYHARLVDSFLRYSSLFQTLSEPERAELQRAFVPMTERERAMLIRQGEPGAGLYLISSGEVSITHQLGARKSTVASLHEGHFFCSLSASEEVLAPSDANPASVEARTDVRLLVLPRALLLAKMEAHAAIREALGRLVSCRQIVIGKTHYARMGIPG